MLTVYGRNLAFEVFIDHKKEKITEGNCPKKTKNISGWKFGHKLKCYVREKLLTWRQTWTSSNALLMGTGKLTQAKRNSIIRDTTFVTLTYFWEALLIYFVAFFS